MPGRQRVYSHTHAHAKLWLLFFCSYSSGSPPCFYVVHFIYSRGGWMDNHYRCVYILTCHFMSPFLPHPLYFFALHHMLLEQCIWHQQNSDHTAYSFTFQQITAFVKAVIFCLISFPRCLFCFSAGVCAFSLCVHTCINQCGDKHLSHILVTHLFSEVKVCCHNLNYHVFLD